MTGRKSTNRKVSPGNKSATPKGDDVFYVGIEGANELRRELLGAAKDIIVGLRKYEQLKENRRQKVEYFLMLKKSIADMNEMLAKLRTLLPETKIRHLVVSAPKVVLTQKVVETKEPKKKLVRKKKPVTELDRLENELKSIENKLVGI